ncbi:MAG: hypothetical protein LBG19_06180 [Prevotellaceae bacterium]|nr:hypothetical protein [Prevotellaceae bacterium]
MKASEYPLKNVGTIISKKEKDLLGPNGYEADIKLKFVSEGLANLSSSFVEHNNRYIAKISYSFPFSLQILSSNDRLIKEIIIANESDVITLYASVENPPLGVSTIDYDKMKLFTSAKDIKDRL